MSGRELRPGETVYSVLTETVTGWQRLDIAPEHWSGPPEGSVGYWQSHIPEEPAGVKKAAPVTVETMWRLFEGFSEDSATLDEKGVCLRYVLGLALIRRKALKLLDVEKTESGEFLLVRRPRASATIRIADPRLSEDRIAEIEHELARLLEQQADRDAEAVDIDSGWSLSE